MKENKVETLGTGTFGLSMFVRSNFIRSELLRFHGTEMKGGWMDVVFFSNWMDLQF